MNDVKMILQTLFNNAVRLVYPQKCCHCQKVGDYLCSTCRELLYYHSTSLDLGLEHSALDQVRAAVSFEPPITSVVHALKYQSVKGIAAWCAHLLYLSVIIPPAEAIIPVPISKQRLRERGYNQAEEIALHLTALSGIPSRSLLKRSKHLSAQAGITNKNQRLSRLVGCFEVVEQALPLPRSVIVIDDVVTTGSTINECAKVLKQAGVITVYGLAVAHGN